MRSLAVAVVVAGLCFSGIAQEKSPFKVKHSPSDKPAKKSAAPMPKIASAGTSASTNAKDLQTLERQSSRNPSAHQAGAKVPKTAAVKPLKESKSTPIQVGGTAKGGSQIRQPANPYKGRLKQKYSHQ